MHTRRANKNAAQRSNFILFIRFEENDVSRKTKSRLFIHVNLARFLRVRVQCSPEWQNQHIYRDRSQFPLYRSKRHSHSVVKTHLAKVSDSTLFMQRRRREAIAQDSADAMADADMMPEGDDDDVPEPEPEPMPKEQQQAKSSTAKMSADANSNAIADAKAAESKIQPEVVDSPAKLSPPLVEDSKLPASNEAKLPSESSDEFQVVENPSMQLCKDFELPLAKTIVEGITYYNTSVGLKGNICSKLMA